MGPGTVELILSLSLSLSLRGTRSSSSASMGCPPARSARRGSPWRSSRGWLRGGMYVCMYAMQGHLPRMEPSKPSSMQGSKQAGRQATNRHAGGEYSRRARCLPDTRSVDRPSTPRKPIRPSTHARGVWSCSSPAPQRVAGRSRSTARTASWLTQFSVPASSRSVPFSLALFLVYLALTLGPHPRDPHSRILPLPSSRASCRLVRLAFSSAALPSPRRRPDPLPCRVGTCYHTPWACARAHARTHAHTDTPPLPPPFRPVRPSVHPTERRLTLL